MISIAEDDICWSCSATGSFVRAGLCFSRCPLFVCRLMVRIQCVEHTLRRTCRCFDKKARLAQAWHSSSMVVISVWMLFSWSCYSTAWNGFLEFADLVYNTAYGWDAIGGLIATMKVCNGTAVVTRQLNLCTFDVGGDGSCWPF
jgi:hypothetical protein